jgi:PAS domain S-box-containing protein
MKKTEPKLKKNAGNRKRVEKDMPKSAEISPVEMKKVIHELHVHKVELQTQNEQLREAQIEVTDTRHKYADLYDFAPVGYFTLDNKGQIIETNVTGADLLGLEKRSLTGQSFHHFITPGHFSIFQSHLQKVIEVRCKQSCNLKLTRKDGSLFDALIETIAVMDGKGKFDHYRSSVTDIIEITEKEEELKRLNRTLKAISDSSKAMMRTTNETEYLHEVCRIVVEDCGHAMLWIGYAEDDEGKTVRPVAYAGFEEGYLETLNITWADTERGRGPTGMAIRTGKPSACRNMLTDPLFKPWREEAKKRGYASSIVFPLMASGKAFGAVTIYSREPDPFSADEVKLLAELADDLAYGITVIRFRAVYDKAKEALRESEERYRSLFSAMTDGFALHEIICTDKGKPCDYRFLDINPAFERLTGLKREEVVDRTVSEVLPDNDTYWVEIYGKVALTGESVHFENYASALDMHYEVFAYRPAPRQFATIFTDITERKRVEAEMTRLASFPRLNPNPIAEVDFTGQIHYLNPAAERLFPDLRKRGPEHPWLKDWQRLVRTFRKNGVKKIAREVNVDESWYHQMVHLVEEARRIRIYGMDITMRKRAEKQLFETNQRLQALMQAVPVGVSFSDDTTCQRITGNLAVLEQFDVNQEDNLSASAPDDHAYGRQVRFFRDGCKLSATELPLQRAIIENKVIPSMELEVKLPSGRSWFTETSGAPVRDAQGNVIAGIAVTVDITERKQMEDALRQSHDNLENQIQERTRELEEAIETQRLLAAELLMTEVRERRRIALDLHDNICQSLAVAKLRLHDLQARATEIDLERPLIEIKEMIGDAIHHTRSILKEISPFTLHEVGLSAAIDALAEQINAKYGLTIIHESPESIGKIDEEVKILLYQATRELLLNIIKHAKVSTAFVSIQEIGNDIRVQVKDDGVGFDVSGAQTMFNRSGGFGLFNIRERLKIWDGHMEIKSGHGMGTCITISVPLKKRSQQ